LILWTMSMSRDATTFSSQSRASARSLRNACKAGLARNNNQVLWNFAGDGQLWIPPIVVVNYALIGCCHVRMVTPFNSLPQSSHSPRKLNLPLTLPTIKAGLCNERNPSKQSNSRLRNCFWNGLQFFCNPMIDFPISADGITRSPPFQLYRNTNYQIFIGIDPMQVDEATCQAVYLRQSVPIPSPCREVTPPIGAIEWVVTQGGSLIAHGSLPAEAADVPRGRPNSWAKDPKAAWSIFSGWYGHPGKGYLIEIRLHSGALNLASFHPRVAIVEPI